ncbi:MAG: type II toxin-antitoxin system mRNA interferase toxin, RelE/StbE family [Nanoarchaeota archaeon]
MYDLEFEDAVEKVFAKLGKKDKKQLEIIDKKIGQILENPYHFKPLCGDMKGRRRVHIDSSFVLIYVIKDNVVRILDYAHHDDIYHF